MAFDVYRLDQLDYDDAEPLLEDYIYDALEAFAQSKVGTAYIKQHPEGGNWIGTFIEMAYVYGEHTLPKMTKGTVQEVMEYIVPRKLTLLDPSDTNDAIDELVAFWTFLDEAYRLRSAKAIAKYLQSIADKFPQWMFDPNRGGMAKNFLMQGMEAGYDMTTEEGIQAFQSEYNQPGQANLPGLSLSETVPMTPPPQDMQQVFDQLGIELPAVGQSVDLAQLMGQFLGAVEQLDPEALAQIMALMGIAPSAPGASLGSGFPDFRTELLQQGMGAEIPLSDQAESLLQAQTINASEPGTILQDFETCLAFVGDRGVPVSGKLQQFSLKLLGELNDRLSHPCNIDLKRPQQKSYPNIHGLYLLLRATGITQVVTKGKQCRLKLNPEVYQSWQALNPTERYFTLLEAWFLRGHPDILGNDRSGPFMMGDRCLQSWPQLTQPSTRTFSNYTEQAQLQYWPGFHNLALMAMFGLITLTSGKPAKGQGWRIQRLEVQPFGDALMTLMRNAYHEVNYQWPSVGDPTQPWGDFQPVLQPYFPEWQQTLALPKSEFRSGRHIFKISLGKMWRRLAISGEATLADLGSLILDSVDFAHDHLDQFTYRDSFNRSVEVVHPACFEGPFGPEPETLRTNQVKIGALPLPEGGMMEYLFDFGACWEFQVQLETVESEAEPDPPKEFQKVKQTQRRRSRVRQPVGEILEVHGEAPEQYPDY